MQKIFLNPHADVRRQGEAYGADPGAAQHPRPPGGGAGHEEAGETGHPGVTEAAEITRTPGEQGLLGGTILASIWENWAYCHCPKCCPRLACAGRTLSAFMVFFG